MSQNLPMRTDHIWGRESCPYDEVIDVRSPGEFAEDHLPGAVNLPVLNDAERAEVGTLYVQVSPFSAKRLGAGYISANIARHLAGPLAVKPKTYRPLLYCWRGGMRSGSIALVLAQIGWRVTVLEGGYKTYRARVRQELEEAPQKFHFRIVAGVTGSAKTQLLHRLQLHGEQILDLELLANHRGSLLGNLGPQPSQKLFESRLVHEFDRLDPARPIWVEAESNKIGSVQIPHALWLRMCASPGVEIAMPITGRVQHLLQEYQHFVNDPEQLRRLLAKLPERVGKKRIAEWISQIDRGAWEEFVASLLTVHYDPGYAASRAKCFPHATTAVPLSGPCPTDLDAAVSAMLALPLP